MLRLLVNPNSQQSYRKRNLALERDTRRKKYVISLFFSQCLLYSALGVLIYKGLLFTMFIAYRLNKPGEDLKWKRSPSLPLQELGKRFATKSDKIRHGRGQPRSSGSSSTRITREKQPLAHAEVYTSIDPSQCITEDRFNHIEPPVSIPMQCNSRVFSLYYPLYSLLLYSLLILAMLRFWLRCVESLVRNGFCFLLYLLSLCLFRISPNN